MAMLAFGGGDNIGEDHNNERQIYDDDVDYQRSKKMMMMGENQIKSQIGKQFLKI